MLQSDQLCDLKRYEKTMNFFIVLSYLFKSHQSLTFVYASFVILRIHELNWLQHTVGKNQHFRFIILLQYIKTESSHVIKKILSRSLIVFMHEIINLIDSIWSDEKMQTHRTLHASSGRIRWIEKRRGIKVFDYSRVVVFCSTL